MVSIIKKHNNITDSILPPEVINCIFNYADMCSSIVKMNNEEIEIFDFNTLKRTMVIKSPIWLFQMSVSSCGKFIVGSNEKSNLYIWNMLSGDLIQKIVLSETDCMPLHTFTPDGDLLVGHDTYVHYFTYSSEMGLFQKEFIFTLPEHGSITRVAHNSVNMYAFGTNTGYIFIFNINTKNSVPKLVHTLTQFTNDDVNEIDCINFNKNILVASSWGKKQICFDLTTNTHHLLEKPKFGNYRTPFIVSNLLITPCMKQVIGSYNFKTFLWDLSTGKIVKKLNFDVHNYHTFTPGGSKFIISCSYQSLKIFDWNS